MVTMAQSAANCRKTHTHVDCTHSLTHLHQHSYKHFVRSASSAIAEFGLVCEQEILHELCDVLVCHARHKCVSDTVVVVVVLVVVVVVVVVLVVVVVVVVVVVAAVVVVVLLCETHLEGQFDVFPSPVVESWVIGAESVKELPADGKQASRHRG